MTKTPKKLYLGTITFNSLKQAVFKAGLYWAQERYDNGSDYVTFGNDEACIVYNTFNGRFIIDVDGKMITEESTEMDGTKWYDDLLDFLYISADNKKVK